MNGLRYIAILSLALWVGGIVALGALAAPTLFELLEARDPAGGRELAGLLFGGIFERFQYSVWGLGFVVLASLAARAALGPRPRRFAARMWTTLAMLAVSAGLALYVAPRIDAIRESVPGPVASLAEDDTRRTEFGRLHGLSNGLMLVTVLAGLGLMWVEMKDTH
jgi:tellurite resistance protein TehA-like permease